jgi:hypothetical protein
VTAVGQLLKLDPRYVADVKQLAEYAATQDFGYNLVEHWHLGRQLLGIQAPLEKKITAGMDARITAKIGEYRNRTRHHYTEPQPIVAQERQIADSMHLVEPIQRKLLYALGYEICFSPEVTADAIAFHPGIYGLHRKASNDLRDVRGTYRIYFSGKGDAEGSVRTLCHEIAHNLWPDHFSPDHAAAIDALAARDQQRFARLNTLLRTPETFDQFAKLHAAYQAGNPQEKEAITQAADQLFASIGINVGGVLPFLKDPFELRNLVTYAQDTLQVEGARYNHSGYASPQERFREVISRFAEVKQVRLRGQPELLNFIAPGLNTIWNQLYIPHLEQVYHQVQRYGTAVPPSAAPAPLTQQPDVAGAPATAVDTKVRQQPAAGGHADACSCQGCVADNAQPDKSVDKSSIHLTKSVHAAQSALDAMGVHASLNYR